jgi:hypothetical protein
VVTRNKDRTVTITEKLGMLYPGVARSWASSQVNRKVERDYVVNWHRKGSNDRRKCDWHEFVDISWRLPIDG